MKAIPQGHKQEEFYEKKKYQQSRVTMLWIQKHVKGGHRLMYGVLYIAYILALLFMGFAMTSRGSIITEKVRTVASIVPPSLCFSILIVAFLEKSFVLGALCLVLYFVVPGVGQTLTLIALREKHRISPLSWIMTILFFAAVVYVIAFGRIV